MTCEHCLDAEEIFDAGNAELERETYLREGPRETTRILLDQLASRDLAGRRLLDVGGGIGAIIFELLPSGIEGATLVEASAAAVRTARAMVEERSLGDRIRVQHGDFLDLRDQIEQADIVTLDRVVCCYPDGEGLVRHTAERARQWYGLIAPRDVWWARIGVWFINAYMWAKRSAFRTYLHDPVLIDHQLKGADFELTFSQASGFWWIALYQRRNGANAA